MSSLLTFYLSRIVGSKIYNSEGKRIGKVKDLLIDTSPANLKALSGRAKVTGIQVIQGKEIKLYDFQLFTIEKNKSTLKITCSQQQELPVEMHENGLLLGEIFLDKQIVDLNGRKLVRVNDVRLVTIADGTYSIAVDVGIEGLLRRIGIAKEVKAIIGLFNLTIPAKFILWDDVEAVDFTNRNIKLSKSLSKLHTLHPSDLADIIEELGRDSRATVFSSLDEEKAADVMEELEPHAQIHLIESMSIEKMADVLEKMPANEAADLLDVIEEERAELLLKEMEAESSQEVRELWEFPDHLVGSLMTTEVLFFNENITVDEVIQEFRHKKPEASALYNLFVTDDKEELIATFSLRDLVVSESGITLREIMKEDPIFLYDDQEIDEIAEIISKYNLLAIPVIDRNHQLQGMVVIDDVVEDLVNKRRTI